MARDMARWHRDTEARIYREQERLIEQEYGTDAKNAANYGWGVSADDDFIGVATKVYGHGVLVSEAECPSEPRKHTVIDHEWR